MKVIQQQRFIPGSVIRWLCLGVMTVFSFSLHAGVAGSRHDLTTGGTGQTTGGTGEVCVFCHTPHGADNTAAVPLWNKDLPAAGSYTRYSTLQTASLDGTEVPIGSVSLACLSCHDGVGGMDVVINAPGSTAADPTLYNAAGIALDGIASPMTGAPVPMLAQDLTDDHPISIQYAGGGCTGANADGQTCTSALFNDDDFNPADKATVNSNPVWWVDSSVGVNGTREKTDMLLYTRTDNVATGEPSVECGSCHDPHEDGTFNNTAGSESVAFLRTTNAASVICTTCHIK